MTRGGTARPAAGGRETGGRGLGAVALGGAAGTLVRAGTDAALAPWSTVLVDLLGAFALGLLLEALAQLPATSDRAGRLRLLLGTGFLGALTTYGTLAVGAAEGLRTAPVATFVELVALLAAGVLAAAVGVTVARRRRASVRPVTESAPVTEGERRR